MRPFKFQIDEMTMVYSFSTLDIKKLFPLCLLGEFNLLLAVFFFLFFSLRFPTLFSQFKTSE